MQRGGDNIQRGGGEAVVVVGVVGVAKGKKPRSTEHGEASQHLRFSRVPFR